MSNECTKRGCRNLETICKDCGRVVCTKIFPDVQEQLKELFDDIEIIADEHIETSIEKIPGYYPPITSEDFGKTLHRIEPKTIVTIKLKKELLDRIERLEKKVELLDERVE